MNDDKPAKGGDVILRQRGGEDLGITDQPGDLVVRPGAGFRGAPGGSIRFQDANGTDVVVIHDNGATYINDERVDTDLLIYRAIRDWFLGAVRET